MNCKQNIANRCLGGIAQDEAACPGGLEAICQGTQPFLKGFLISQ
jgi:hypothetical protein